MWRNEGKWSPSAGVDDILDRMLIARIGCAELLRHSKNLLEHERMKDISQTKLRLSKVKYIRAVAPSVNKWHSLPCVCCSSVNFGILPICRWSRVLTTELTSF